MAYPKALAFGVFIMAAMAQARTFEGFTWSAKAGISLDNPFVPEYYRPGNAFFALSPGLKLFENRLVLEGDIGITEKLFRRESDEWVRSNWRSKGDTLYKTITWTEQDSDVYRFFYAYKGVLNAGSWSLFAGHMVFVRWNDSKETEWRSEQFTTSAVDSLQHISTDESDWRYQWGYGMVAPVYGVSRRFGRWALHLQGVGVFSLQALVAVSLNPIRAIGSHK